MKNEICEKKKAKKKIKINFGKRKKKYEKVVFCFLILFNCNTEQINIKITGINFILI